MIKSLIESLRLYLKIKMNLSKKLKSYALLATMSPMIVLTSCGGSSSPKTSSLNIYQPSSLKLKAGQPIQTEEGVYTPQTNEVWHSDARYRKLERELYNK